MNRMDTLSPLGGTARRAAIMAGAVLLLAAGNTAHARKPPPCPPAAPQLFLSPMGEPFRAGPDKAYPVADWFRQADRDGDGKLTSAEMVADADRFFQLLDVDHDGEIIPAEMTRYERDIAPEIRLYARGRTEGPPSREERRRERRKPEDYGAPLGAGRWSFLNLPQPVSAADEDLNRGVTRAEFEKAARDRMAQIDRATLGYLDLSHLPLTPAQQAATNCTPIAPAAPTPPPERRRDPR